MTRGFFRGPLVICFSVSGLVSSKDRRVTNRLSECSPDRIRFLSNHELSHWERALRKMSTAQQETQKRQVVSRDAPE